MQYRKLGNTGLKVSSLGFGSMRLPMQGGHVKTRDSITIIQRAFQRGVNLIDSAVGYCNRESELTVGKALKGWRDKVVVSTKNHYKGNDPYEWVGLLNQSLRRLSVDHIDVYNFHDLKLHEFQRWNNLDHSPLDAMKHAREEGLVKHIGLSSHDTPTNMAKLLDTGFFESLILQYNLLNTTNEPVIDHAKSNDIGIIIMGPVGGGRLAPQRQRRFLSNRVENTPELALRFVLSNPGVSAALSGMNTIPMVDENTAAASNEKPLTHDERTQIQVIMKEKKTLAQLYCTGCGYCMPCPNGVNIPRNLELINNYRLYNLVSYSKNQYRQLGHLVINGTMKPAWAAVCHECGECEGKCPQNIEVRKWLKIVNKTLQ